MLNRILISASIILILATCVNAQSTLVAPNAYANATAGTGGTGLNTFIRDSGNARTGQLLINSSQLGAMQIGDKITGIAFRLYTGNTTGFPALTATWTNYTINVGVGVAFGSQTTTFASNFVGTPTQVRTGPLTVNAGSYLGSGTPRPFGTMVSFTNPYTYTGGNLLIEIRHTGSNIVNGTTDFLEAVPIADAQYGPNLWSATATGETATVGAQATFTISQLTFISAVPEPTTIALCGMSLAGAGYYGWRRWKTKNQAMQLSLKSRYLRN